MNRIFFALVLSMFVSAIGHAEDVKTISMTIPVNSAFVPGGFDTGSDVYVVVSGLFPNSCYSWGGADVNLQSSTPQIEVVVKANVVQERPCMRVLVPFQKEVRLGQLSEGRYELRFANGDGTYFTEVLNIDAE